MLRFIIFYGVMQFLYFLTEILGEYLFRDLDFH
jgi:hypothetical protein